MEQLTDHEKSVILARAQGWEIQVRPTGYTLFRPTPKHGWYNDLYEINPDNDEPRYMALAWRVLNWALENRYSLKLDDSNFWHLWTNDIPKTPLAVAVRLLLDLILGLIIEAGIVEVEHD